ncbi:MAG TPA: hypothetical protein V6D35_14860 [Candidatus Sericytochromatia bacterium]|jgi:hypothetical protein
MDNNASGVILLTSNGYVAFTSSTSDRKAEATASHINTADCRFMKYSNSTWKISIR